MFSSAGKRCFTIESLVAKENPLTAEEPICPTALTYSNPTTDALMNGYQAPPARSLYQSPDLVFPETVNHHSLTVAPHQLAGSHLHHPHFFGTQHRDPLNFYPWVLRNRFFGHRFQGKWSGNATNRQTWVLFDFLFKIMLLHLYLPPISLRCFSHCLWEVYLF